MSARLFKQSENIDVVPYAPLLSDAGAAVNAQANTLPSPASLHASPSSVEEQCVQAKSHPTNPQEEATAIMAQAQTEAERIISEARLRALALEQEVRDQGLQDVSAQAAAEASRLLEPLREKLVQTLEEVAHLQTSLMARVESDLLRLALEVAKKIVQREVTVDHEVALTLTRVALSRLHNRALATVRLHPEDYAYVNAHSERLGSHSSIEIVADRSIGRGGCLVETEMGDVDARIEQQFAEIERGFFE